MLKSDDGSRGSRTRRSLREWAPFGVVGLALLAASEVLWWWQTWTVRTLLEALGPLPP